MSQLATTVLTLSAAKSKISEWDEKSGASKTVASSFGKAKVASKSAVTVFEKFTKPQKQIPIAKSIPAYTIGNPISGNKISP